MPRPDKFYLIELVEDPRGYRDEDHHGRRQLARPGRRRDDHASRITEQLRFTLSSASGRSAPRAIGGRFGIKESTGGIGARPLPARRPAGAVGRRVRRAGQPVPARQGDAAVRVWKRNLFLVGGADDVINYDARAAGGGRRHRLVPGRAAGLQRRGSASRCCCSAAAPRPAPRASSREVASRGRPRGPNLDYAAVLDSARLPSIVTALPAPPEGARADKMRFKIKEIGDDGLAVNVCRHDRMVGGGVSRPRRAARPGRADAARGASTKSGDDYLLRGELRGDARDAVRALPRAGARRTSTSR